MPSVNDWAARAADRIDDEYPHARGKRRPSVDRVAAIIATFAEPLVGLLRESRRLHEHYEGQPQRCCPQCACESWIGDEQVETDDDDEYPANRPDEPCACGADAWNARVDAALAGAK